MLGCLREDRSLEIGTLSNQAAPGTHPSDPAAHPGLFSGALQVKSANFTAASFGRYEIIAALTVSDPATATAGDCYMVRIASGSATIGGISYLPSRFDVVRYYNGSSWTTQPAVITGGILIDGMTRKLLTSYTLPAAPALSNCTYYSASKTFTCTAHGLSANQPIKLLSGTGALPAGFSAYTSDFTGPVYYTVGVTTNAFQLSATRGGTAVTTSDSGTTGWTATPIGVSAITISGLSIVSGARFRVRCTCSTGMGWASTLSAYPYIRFNGDASTKYRNNNNEQNAMTLGSCGNVSMFQDLMMTITGGWANGTLVQGGLYGADRTAANSTTTQTSGNVIYESESESLIITSITLSDGSGASQYFKPGTVIVIEQEL